MNEVDQGEWVEVFESPKVFRLPSYLKDECHMRRLKLEMDVDKGWFRDTVRIKVTGPTAGVDRFRKDVYALMDAYNRSCGIPAPNAPEKSSLGSQA